jgi:hypothetical protein
MRRKVAKERASSAAPRTAQARWYAWNTHHRQEPTYSSVVEGLLRAVPNQLVCPPTLQADSAKVRPIERCRAPEPPTVQRKHETHEQLPQMSATAPRETHLSKKTNAARASDCVVQQVSDEEVARRAATATRDGRVEMKTK